MQRKWKRRWQRLIKIVLPPVTAGLLLFSVYNTAYANPAGGAVTSGAASITTSGTTTTIQQTTDKAAINWQSFNIGKGETVKFIQPSSSSIALNRVIGSDASAIYGTLSANGKVFLINPNGILFAPGSQVNVGGLVASTLNMSDNDFMKGKTTFTGNGDGVINQGSITAQNYAVLIGPQVKNEGVISAQVTGMAAGSQVSLAFNGDKLLNVTVDTGIANGSAVNSGQILADGGLVVMSAGTKDALLSTVVNNSGVIRAQSFNNVNGVIRLEGSTVVNSGTLDASGKASGQTGGTIKVLGDNVTLTSTAVIDVSGDAGGGTALIGGAYQGKGPEYNAINTTVAAGAIISADALTSGNGGQVVVWANDTTNFAGRITARGGSQRGNGGSVETSGKKTLNIADSARVTTLAAKGKAGTWLLDPTNYTIGTGANAANYMNNTYLSTQLGSTDMNILTLSAGSEAGDITIAAPVTWSGSNSLTLSAYRNINVNSTLQNSGTGNLVFKPNNSTAFDGISYGNLLVGNGGSVSLTGGGKLFFGNQQYTLINTLAEWNSMPLSGYYALNADIAGVGSPKGDYANPFTGTLEGLGHKVSLNITSGSYSGLFGKTGEGARLRNIGVDGSITLTGYGERVGGLVGSNNSGNIINCHSDVNLTANLTQYIGGLVGYNVGGAIGTGLITNSYSTGDVNTTDTNVFAGGLVGLNTGASIEKSYSTGVVNAPNTHAGGLVGKNTGAVSNSYSTGDVTGDIAGGLAGYNSGSIRYSFSTGKTTGSTAAGGLVGENQTYAAGFVADCVWDKENSSLATAAGFDQNGNAIALPYTSGLTTTQMQTASTFSSWDQTVWKFYDGNSQPLLKSFLKPLTITANAANITKTYDGLSTVYSGTVTYSTGSKPAEVSGDIVYTDGGVNAGVYTPTSLYSGQQGYDITFINTGGTLTVNKASLSYVANATSRTYGDANPILAGAVTGFKGSDTLSNATNGALIWSTTADNSSNTGSYAVTGSGLTADNYDFVQAASNGMALTVNKATLTVTANAVSKIYGENDPNLTYEVNGLKNNDQSYNILNGSLARAPGETVTGNSYAINQGTLSSNSNYTINYIGGELTITPRTLIVTANNVSRYVGQPTPSFTATYSGLVAGDTPASLSGNLIFNTSAISSSPAGNYTITLTGTMTSPNYTVNYVDGLMSITGQVKSPAYDSAIVYASHMGARGAGGIGDNGLQRYQERVNGYRGGSDLVTIAGVGVNTNGYVALTDLSNIVNNGIDLSRLD